MDKTSKTEQQWRASLTPEQYHVCREKGTERPFTGVYYQHNAPGTYLCVCCRAPLFSSAHKYDSGSGWPSFWQAGCEQINEIPDHSLSMVRTEVTCARCDAHLGHLFPDGPAPTGLRYCVNSTALLFQEAQHEEL